jgi:hypothetical protein
MASSSGAGAGTRWSTRFIRNALLWLLPAAAVWLLLTPFYNLFLTVSGENLLHLVESPNVTDLLRADVHMVSVQRLDFPPGRALVHSFRVTDLHFHLVLLAALLLAVPGVPWRRRFGNLGLAVLLTVFFDILLVFFQVKFAYATQLGSWSMAHYGAFARNAYGMGKHLLDLPIKLAWPFILWAGFYLKNFREALGRDYRTSQNPPTATARTERVPKAKR